GRIWPRLCGQWAEAASHRGWPLPDGDLLAAASWLDWIGPALCRHRDGVPLRAMAGMAAAPADETVAQDRSRWDVRVWEAEQVAALAAAEAAVARDAVDWRAIAAPEARGGGGGAPARPPLAGRVRRRD